MFYTLKCLNISTSTVNICTYSIYMYLDANTAVYEYLRLKNGTSKVSSQLSYPQTAQVHYLVVRGTILIYAPFTMALTSQ